MRYQLGERILVDCVLERDTSERTGVNDRIWVVRHTDKRTAVVVGRRSLKNGTIENYEGEGPLYFRECGRVSALLVAERIDRKPFLVPALREWQRMPSPEWEDRLQIGDGFVYGTRRAISECSQMLLNGQMLQEVLRRGG